MQRFGVPNAAFTILMNFMNSDRKSEKNSNRYFIIWFAYLKAQNYFTKFNSSFYNALTLCMNFQTTKYLTAMKKLYLCLVMAFTALTVNTAFGQANVQVIHNSADPAAREVDVYIDTTLALDNFTFRTATEFLALGAGEVTIGVAPATSNDPEDGAGIADTIASFNFTLVDGESYVLVATGVLSPDDFDASVNAEIGFTIAAFTPAQQTAAADSVALLAYHGSTDAPRVDVNAQGVGTLVPDIGYGEFAGYVTVPAASFTLDVAVAGTETVAHTVTADLSTLGGNAAVVVASGFLNPLTNQAGAGFELLAVLPDGTVVTLPEVVPAGTDIVVSGGTGDAIWTAENTYILDGFVFVEDGDTLIIEAGTVIKGETGQGAQASALIVARGGFIQANGTAADPIIFTSILDDVTTTDDIPLGTSGLWGGVIILGNASLNSEPGQTAIEGIPVGEARGLYGAIDTDGDGVFETFNDEDNSGSFRYASIRYGGSDIGAGNEINGLTLGGVGSGTTIEFVEVIFNADDGIEFFGGTVNTKWMAAAFCGDDAFDYDEGFRGKGQFWFVIQAEGFGDRGGEHDGGTTPETAEPFATPEVFNATFIGPGEAVNTRTITFRDNAGGEYNNSIFVEYGQGIDIERLASGTNSFERLEAGDLELNNNVFWNVAGNDSTAIFTAAGNGATPEDATFLTGYFTDQENVAANPSLVGISRTNDGGLDPRPQGVSAFTNFATLSDEFFTPVSYKGAFGSGGVWLDGWSALDEFGYFPEAFEPVGLDTANSASVQVIHNAGDPSANVVDIYLDSALLIDDFGYRTATPFVSLPAGVEINIGVAGGESAGPGDIIAEFPFTLEAGGTFIVTATGVLSPEDFDTSANAEIGFTLAAAAGQSEGTTAGVDLLVYHGATDAPAVDVRTGGANLVSNISYGEYNPAGYFEAPATALQIDIAPTGADSIASFTVDLGPLAGGTAVVQASGFLNPLTNQGGAGFTLIAVLPDGTVLELDPVVPGEVIRVTDNTGDGTTTWTANNTYVLDGFVFVEDGDTLVIEPGTVVQAESGQGAQASALIVARGGYIIADGTAADPIIFTSVLDDVNVADDVPVGTSGLWGGVIILGNASLNSDPGQTAIEGIPVGEARGLYGAIDSDGDGVFETFDDTDNSGIFRYASIRHGGSDIGAGNEINGLTLGGVGSGTTIEFVEVIFNADDGIEFFGGTVNTRYMAAVLCGDDAFDYDEGYRGNGQFWFVLQADGSGDRGGEHDGGTTPETAEPFATPVIFNATFIGPGEPANTRTITFRDNAGGSYVNSIFTEYGRGIDVEKLASGTHSFDRLVAGDLNLSANVFWNVAGNDSTAIFTVAGAGAEEADQTFIQTYFGDEENFVANPSLVGISRTNDGGLDPRPQGFAGTVNLDDEPNGFVDVEYRGAFAPADSGSTNTWLANWTALDQLGYLGFDSLATSIAPERILTGFNFYPNPTTDMLTVEADELTQAPLNISLFNMMGQEVLNTRIQPINGSVREQINISNLNPAVYILRATQGNKITASRVVVQ